MKVLLIAPTLRYDYLTRFPTFLSNTDFPSGFAYLAGALKNSGHEVYGLNPNNHTEFKTAKEMVQTLVKKACADCQPDLIGLGGICTDFVFLKDVSDLLREIAPSTPIVMGGGILTHDAEFIFQTLTPDYCIIGEGEEAIVAITDSLESDAPDFEKIPNIGYWHNDQAKFTKRSDELIDIDKLAFPDYAPFNIEEMMVDFAYTARYGYRYTRNEPRPMTIVAARNCPFNCTFCVHNNISRYRARSIANIMEEIRVSYQKYRFNVLIILDELFATGNTRLKEFCAALKDGQEKYGWDFDWAFQTHAKAKMDKETLEMVKDAGCFFFSYGMESASARVLDSMNKKTKPVQLIEAVELADQVKIGIGGNLIFGDPAETPETISETLNFYRNYCTDNHIFMAELKPYPGSKIFDDCIEKGIITDKLQYYIDIDKYGFNMTTMPDTDWNYWIEQIVPALASSPFATCVDAIGITRDNSLADKTITDFGRKQLWQIKAECPFCQEVYFYPEIIDEKHVSTNGHRVLTGCPNCHKRVNINIPVAKGTGILIKIESVEKSK